VIRTLNSIEPWSAARRLSDGPSPYALRYGFILTAVATLVVLILLLWGISRRRRAQSQSSTRELFAENAVRRGLSGRERQILLAIVMRSGLGRSHDIFTTVDAFDRGATKLLAECVRTRTADENEQLKTEVAYLREKLGFRALRSPRGIGISRRPSSRDIPVGKAVEVACRQRHAGVPMRAEVVRNDDLELALELDAPLETCADDLWCVRYAFGVCVWEFDAAAVTCSETRVVLNHTDNVRFVNRRRFHRVAVTMPALVACFPFTKRGGPGTQGSARGARYGAGGDRIPMDIGIGAPAFVQGVVTELAGPGLRIEVPMQIRPGERVLVVFRPTGVAGAGSELAVDETYIVEDVGQVRHSRVTSTGVSIAVELSGLNESEIDELVRMTNVIVSRAGAQNDADGVRTEIATVAAAGAAVVQEV
jgi:hypothetical protein